MASPFAAFRKHQKVWIATAGLLAIIAFVFLPLVLKNMDSRASSNPVVVKTSKYGNLKRSHLDALIRQRQKVLDFMQRVGTTAVRNSDNDQEVAARISYLNREYGGRIGTVTEAAVVNSWLLTQYASEMGTVVSDRAIQDFIKMLSDNRVTKKELIQKKKAKKKKATKKKAAKKKAVETTED